MSLPNQQDNEMKVPEKWKRPFRLVLATFLLAILFMLNDWGVDFKISFHLKSVPIEREDPAPEALQVGETWTQSLVSIARLRLSPTTPTHDYVLMNVR